MSVINNKQLGRQLQHNYTNVVEDRLVKGNDVTKVKKENYIMKR